MLKKLSLSKKLFLSNLMFGIPAMLLMLLLAQAKTKDINFSAKEKIGNNYQKPLESLLEGISRHRLVAQRAINHDTASQRQLGELQQKVDTAFNELGEADKKFGVVLDFTDAGLGKRKRDNYRYEKVRAKWDGMKAKLSSLRLAESNEQHLAIIADIRGMIGHAGDTSNLILDPDLDTYYLMDVTLAALPQMQDRIQEIIGFVEPILRRKQMSDAERLQVGIYASLLKLSDMDRVAASAQTAVNEDSNFLGISPTLAKNISPAVIELNNAISTFVGLNQQIAAEVKVTVLPEQYLASAEKALATSYSTWHTAATEMDQMLDIRVNRYTTERFFNMLWGAMALMFACLVAIVIAKNVSGGLTQLGVAATQLKSSVDATNSASRELVDTSQKLSAGSTEQSSAIAETAATLNEISAMVNKSLENANRSVEVVSKSQDRAVKGKGAVEQMITAIGEINSSNEEIMRQVEDSNRQIGEITTIIGEIGHKTKVINDIVFQTKLLSFNASVEAARAGEHGKGFAVVAEEVGNLAQMSGNAAKEISDMLAQSMDKVRSIVENTKSNVQGLVALAKTKVDAGTQIAQQCGTALEEIVQSVAEVNTMSGEISKAQEEQARGVSEITKAMQQLEEITHQHAEMSHETSRYAEELSTQSVELRKVVRSIEAEIMGQQNATVIETEDTSPNSDEANRTPKRPSGGSGGKKLAEVIPLGRNVNKSRTALLDSGHMKKAAGLEDVPSENDPRFEDV